MTSLRASCLVLLLHLLEPSALAQERLDRASAVARALERNTQLRLADADRAAARAELAGASNLLNDNPELEAAVGPRFGPGGSTLDIGAGVGQRLELFGQRGARIDSARARLAVAEALFQMRRIELASQVRESFGSALAAAAAAQVSQEGRELAAQSLKAAEERFAAGASNKIDVNAARVEMGRATREASLADQRRKSAVARLQVLVGLTPGSLLELEGTLQSDVRPPQGTADFLALALKQRPDLTASRAELEAARSDQTLASRELLPSPRIGVTYGREEGSTIVQGTLGFDLPLFNQNQARRGVTSARLLQAEQNLVATERQIQAELAVAVARYTAAATAAEAYAGPVSSAITENLELINEAYRAGKVDFLELLVVRRQAIEERLASIDVLEELNAAEAELKRAIGSLE